MTSKEGMLLALRREVPDRIPPTVHQRLPYHLDKYLGGIDALTAFRRFGLGASLAILPVIEEQSPDWRLGTRLASWAAPAPGESAF
jgi:hypothetical protein